VAAKVDRDGAAAICRGCERGVPETGVADHAVYEHHGQRARWLRALLAEVDDVKAAGGAGE
jgi:hypothetical protein